MRLTAWLARHRPATLAALAVLAACVYGFLQIADKVFEGDTQAVDRAILLAMRSPGDTADLWGPRWLEEVGRDCTALGGMAAMTLLSAAVAGFLILRRRGRAAALLLAAVIGGLVLSLVLKGSYERPRPDLVPHGSIVMTSSFPSGHSMMSAVTYLTLGALLAGQVDGRALRIYVLALACGLTLLVGVSRVYLGVHWPTDVLAGWAAGTAWAILCWLAAGRLLRSAGAAQEATDGGSP